MSTWLAAVGFLGDRRLAGPLYRLIIAVDIAALTTCTDPVKGELRRVAYDLLEHALEAVAITGNHLEPLTDRGDGILALARSHDNVPKTRRPTRPAPPVGQPLARGRALGGPAHPARRRSPSLAGLADCLGRLALDGGHQETTAQSNRVHVRQCRVPRGETTTRHCDGRARNCLREPPVAHRAARANRVRSSMH
jgi:hypothetical protein